MRTALDHHTSTSHAEALGRLVEKHAVGFYFVLTLLISWTGIVVLLGRHAFPLTWEHFERLGGALYGVILAGPVVAGLAMTGVVDGHAGYRELFRRLGKWRVGARAYGLALLPAIVLAVVAAALSWISTGSVPTIFTASNTASTVGLAVIASLTFGLFEEVGWTGFAVPKLRNRHGAVATGIIVGLVWGAWHFPLFWAADSFSAPLPFAILLLRLFSWLPGFRILMVRLYDRTGSVLLPVLMHASLVATQLLFMPPSTSDARLVLHLGVWAATIWILVAVMRPRKLR